MKKIISAAVLCLAMLPSTANASTCMIHKGAWICGASTMAGAKAACNVTTGDFEHTCDAGINVCTCSTGSASSSSGRIDLKGVDLKALIGSDVVLETKPK